MLDRLDRALELRNRLVVFALIVLSFLVKLAYVLASADALHVTVPLVDSAYYDRMARDLVAGLPRSEPFFYGPLYPHVMALVYRLTDHSIATLRGVQALGGAVAVGMTFVLGRTLFRPVVGLLAAILLLLYGPATFYEGQLLMMWLGTLLNVSALVVLVRMDEASSWRPPVAAGLLLGLSALARANVLVVVPIAAVWIYATLGGPHRLRHALGLVLASVLAVAPATVHNAVVAGDFVPITSNGGVNFYIGNSAEATGIYGPPRGLDLAEDPTSPLRYVEEVLGRDVAASEASAYWFNEALDDMHENPGRAISLFVRKAALFVNGFEVPQIESYDVARTRYPGLRLLFVSFWLLVSFSAVGMLDVVRARRREWLLVGYVLGLAASIVLFFVTARYRMPIIPVLCLFAAHGVVTVFPAAFRSHSRGLVPVVVLLLFAFIARPSSPAMSSDDLWWREHVHQAKRLALVGRADDAVREMDRAVELRPRHAESYVKRAILQREAGLVAEAADDYQRALEFDPESATTAHDYGESLRQLGRLPAAVEAYQRAIALDPTMLQAHNNLGIAYAAMGEHARAIDAFTTALQFDPSHSKAYNNLGAAYANLGQMDRAIRAFERAIAVDPSYASSYKNLATAHLALDDLPAALVPLERYSAMAPSDDAAAQLLERIRAAIR